MLQRIFLLVTVLLLASFVSGCSFLPRQIPVTDDEKQMVAAVWRELDAEQPACRSIDANATVKFDSFLQSGSLSGYLQAMWPSYLKFIGLNPIGQPMMILVSDGRRFRYVTVQEAKGYEGSVHARAFMKYAPDGFEPEFGFAWLTGRLPDCAAPDFESVSGDEDGAGYWVECKGGPGMVRHRVLLDIKRRVVLRHSIRDDLGKAALDVSYGDFQPGICRWPGELRVTSRKSQGSMMLLLHDIDADGDFSESDFEFETPAGYEKVLVQ